MSVGVHHRLEIVQIQEDHGKFPALLDYLGNEAVHAEEEIAAVIKAGDLINEGAGLKFLEITYVVHRNGHVVRQDIQVGERLLPEEILILHVDHFKDSDDLIPHHQGQ